MVIAAEAGPPPSCVIAAGPRAEANLITCALRSRTCANPPAHVAGALGHAPTSAPGREQSLLRLRVISSGLRDTGNGASSQRLLFFESEIADGDDAD